MDMANMKAIEDMTGVEKAAALLVAMGHDTASEIMKFLDEDSIYKISTEIAKINLLSANEKDDLVGEFIVQLKKIRKMAPTGEEIARTLLTEAFGCEKAEAIISKTKQIPLNESFDFLNNADPQTVIDLVSGEHPQIITVLIAHVTRECAGTIMKSLPKDIAKDVALRLAKMGKASPDAIIRVSESLRKKYSRIKGKGESSIPGGLNTLAGIINHLGSDAEKRIMSSIDDDMPEYAQEIRKKITIFEFEAIATLTNKEIRLILERIGENRTLAKSIKGTDDIIKYKILRNMSNNRATEVLNLSDLMGPVKLSEVTEARMQMVSIMRELNEKGLILIRKHGEDIVR
jgi:flagellar motor switch protein FliG